MSNRFLLLALATTALAQETAPLLFKDATPKKGSRNAIARSIPGQEIRRSRLVEVDRSAFSTATGRYRLNLFENASFDID